MIITIVFLFFFTSFNAVSVEIPVANFVKHGDYLNMKLSLDGKHISARFRNGGQVYLVFLDTATMQIVGGVKPSSSDELHSATWINNERIVYQFRERFINLMNRLPQVSCLRLILMELSLKCYMDIEVAKAHLVQEDLSAKTPQQHQRLSARWLMIKSRSLLLNILEL